MKPIKAWFKAKWFGAVMWCLLLTVLYGAVEYPEMFDIPPSVNAMALEPTHECFDLDLQLYCDRLSPSNISCYQNEGYGNQKQCREGGWVKFERGTASW